MALSVSLDKQTPRVPVSNPLPALPVPFLYYRGPGPVLPPEKFSFLPPFFGESLALVENNRLSADPRFLPFCSVQFVCGLTCVWDDVHFDSRTTAISFFSVLFIPPFIASNSRPLNGVTT